MGKENIFRGLIQKLTFAEGGDGIRGSEGKGGKSKGDQVGESLLEHDGGAGAPTPRGWRSAPPKTYTEARELEPQDKGK